MTDTPSDRLATAVERPFKVLAIGEIVLRVANMDSMLQFYSRSLGLTLLRRFGDEVAFMKVAEGVAGQVQTLTLFSKRKLSNFDDSPWTELCPTASTLHHFALTISLIDFESTKAYLLKENIPHNIAVHTWIGWRSIFLHDPESNTVELVCYDSRIDRRDSYDYTQLYGDLYGEK